MTSFVPSLTSVRNRWPERNILKEYLAKAAETSTYSAAECAAVAFEIDIAVACERLGLAGILYTLIHLS